MSAQDRVDEMAAAGMWLGGSSMKRCTCTRIVREHLHDTSCPRWVSEWIRRARVEREQRGMVAVADKTAY